MSLEKLGVLFLLNYFNQLGTVKNHLLLACKEVLLAIQSSIEIVNQSTSQTILGSRAPFISPAVEQVQKILNYTIEKITPQVSAGKGAGNSEETMRLKDHIVSSIVSAIDDEIENTKGTLNEKSKLKIEALHTVKQVLITQKRKPYSGFAKPEEKRVAKSA